jgi:hypothetical protein
MNELAARIRDGAIPVGAPAPCCDEGKPVCLDAQGDIVAYLLTMPSVKETGMVAKAKIQPLDRRAEDRQPVILEFARVFTRIKKQQIDAPLAIQGAIQENRLPIGAKQAVQRDLRQLFHIGDMVM